MAFGQEYFSCKPHNTQLFGLTAPTGWICEGDSKYHLVLGAFSKQGNTGINDKVTIVVSLSPLEDKTYPTFDVLIKHMITNYEKAQRFEIIYAKDIVIHESITATCKYYKGDSLMQFGAIAYINGGQTGISIVMISQTQEEFDNSLADFESLVKSFFVKPEEEIDMSKNLESKLSGNYCYGNLGFIIGVILLTF